MDCQEARLVGPRNQSIFYRTWTPSQAPRAVLVLVHGASEHSGRYARFADALTRRGIAVMAPDLIGHGHSDGTPGFVEAFDDHLRTVELIRECASSTFASTPQILFGHSMGGLIVAQYLLEHQSEFRGCVLSGPAIKTEVDPPALQLLIGRLLSRFLPRVGLLQLDAKGVSRDPAEVERYLKDPLVYTGKLSARVVVELFRAMEQVRTNAGRIELPLLLLHGGADSMTSPEGSRFLDASVSSREKTLRIYPNLYHEILNEPERDEVTGEILDWCDQRLA